MLCLLDLESFLTKQQVNSLAAAAQQAWSDQTSSVITTNRRLLAQAEPYNTTIYSGNLGSGWSIQTLGVANNYSQVAGAGLNSGNATCATLQPGVCYYHPCPRALSRLTPVIASCMILPIVLAVTPIWSAISIAEEKKQLLCICIWHGYRVVHTELAATLSKSCHAKPIRLPQCPGNSCR